MKFNKLLLMLSLLFLVLLMSCGDNPDVINSDNTDNISENDSNDEKDVNESKKEDSTNNDNSSESNPDDGINWPSEIVWP